MQVAREILAEYASDTSLAAHTLRIQALFYALKSNSWQSVQLLLDSGVTLPNRDGSLKGLYPRESFQSVNDDTAVPDALFTYMASEDIKMNTISRFHCDYQSGVFSDEVLGELGCIQRGGQSEAQLARKVSSSRCSVRDRKQS